MLEIGSVVDGKYKVLNKIGQGGMSIVYLVMNERANKQWAIKEVRKDGVRDFEVVKQGLVVETDMLKRLKNPHLPSIVDVIDQKDNFLIVMDYIEGNPLSEKLKEYGAQPQELVIEWAKQLCDVLGYLHTRTPAIIYRDMKPANIMLKPDGNLTLIDFGTAREYKEYNIADTTCLGTRGYAAPEQFGGKGQTDERTDIYCLGATLYHLVTGMNPCEPPFEIKPIRQINPLLSSGLEKIILKCTKQDPSERYQSCAELMYALEHYDEIDDRYRRRQKIKLAVFLGTLVLFGASIGTAIYAKGEANLKMQEQYEEILEQANSFRYYDKDYEGDYSWMEQYERAMKVTPSRKEAYLDLMEALVDEKSDGEENILTEEEYKRVSSMINTYSDSLGISSQDYSEVMYQMGYMCFMYFDYGSEGESDNMEPRLMSAYHYFGSVAQNSENYDKAQMYMKMYEYAYEVTKYVEKNDRLPENFDALFDNYCQYLSDIVNNKADITTTNIANLTRLFATATSRHCKKIIKRADNYPEKLMKSMESVDQILVTVKGEMEEASDEKREFFQASIDSIQVCHNNITDIIQQK